MPIFEFVCAACGKPFEELVRSASAASEVVCPACHSANIKKKISTFASKVAGGSSFSFNSAPASSCSTGGG
jgi:putative FmdB family regulatory protein